MPSLKFISDKYLLFFSVVGHSEPQHTCDRHHSCAFSACQPRVLVHQKPGKRMYQCRPCLNFNSLCEYWIYQRCYLFLSFVFWYISQGRQKLARFSAHEFATLVIDILTDAKRRQWGNSCESLKGNVFQLLFFNTLNFLTNVCLCHYTVNMFLSTCTEYGDKTKIKQWRKPKLVDDNRIQKDIFCV